MSKQISIEEERLNAVRQYQEGLKLAKKELFSLFKSGVPLGVFSKIFDDDQDFQGVSAEWGKAIESFKNKYADYIYDINLRWLILDFLERLPKSKKVYLIHDLFYQNEAWVVGDLEAANLCLNGLVDMHIRVASILKYVKENHIISELDGEPNIEEDAESIRSKYVIEKVTVKVLERRNSLHNIKKSGLNDLVKNVLCMKDLDEKINFAYSHNLIPDGCAFCMQERGCIDKSTPFCRKSLDVGKHDLIYLRPFTSLQDPTLCFDFLWPADCREFIETLAVAVNARNALFNRAETLLRQEGESTEISDLWEKVYNHEQGDAIRPIINKFYKLLVDRED